MSTANRLAALCLIGIFAITQSGCTASYVTPGRAADMRMVGVTAEMQKAQTDPGIRAAMQSKPLASLPAAIAVVRIQGPNYRSNTAEGWGSGKFTVVTTRDIEKDEDFARLEKLPMIKGLAPINRLLLNPD